MRSPQVRESRTLFSCRCWIACALLGLANGSDGPIFRSKPTIVKTSEHDTVLLPCFIDNLGTNSIRWWKDEQLVWDTSNTALLAPANVRMFSANNTLEVSDVSAADTGEYTCQVIRPEPWGPLNQIHAIEVQSPPLVKPVPEAGELEVKLHEEAILGCAATGVPQPAISWTFQGKELQLLSNRATLTFTVTNRGMEGEYQCIANNGVAEPTTASIFLRILYPPEVISEKMWIHTAPGLRVELSCSVFANPEAKVEWLKDNTIVNDRPRIITHRNNDKHLLIIRNVRRHDLGYYTCRASNVIGQGRQMIELSGVPNPAVLDRSQRLSNKENITLIWKVDSYSTIYEYNLLFRVFDKTDKKHGEWTRLVIPADTSSHGPIHSQSYMLTGLKESNRYEVFVSSRNSFGWSRPSRVLQFSIHGGDLYEDVEGTDETLEEVNEQQQEDEEEETNNIQSVISADFEAAYNEQRSAGTIFLSSTVIIVCSTITLSSL